MGGRGSQAPIAIVTCIEFAGADDDWPKIREALDGRGIAAEHPAWDDPAVDWEGYQLLVLRSVWDYTVRPDEFLRWVRAAAAVSALQNPLPVVEWSMDKRYLADLGTAGVPVVPTQYVEPGHAWTPPPGEFVVKPSISGGGIDTARYSEADRDDSIPHLRALHARGATAMVQEYIRAVDDEGETAIISFDGDYSHAFHKGPLLERGTGVVDRLWERQVITPTTPTERQREVAAATLATVEDRFGATPISSRIDLVCGPDGDPLVLEAELIDPVLFLEFDPGSADRLAGAIARALTSLSAGASRRQQPQ